LSNNQRLGFFNVTGAIAAAGLSLSGWRVYWDAGGIQPDRTFFVAGAGATNLLVQVQASNSFSRDIGGGHGAYSESYRRNVFSKSLQLSFTPDGKYLDADIDIYNPNLKGGYVFGLVLHGVEVLANKMTGKPTDPYEVAFRSNWECK
jgi:hypothetical protein